METESQCIQNDFPRQGTTRYRTICIMNMLLASPIHILENRPIQLGARCLSNELESNFHTHFSPFYCDRKCFEEGTTDQGLIIITSAWQTQTQLQGLLKIYVRNQLLPESQDLLVDSAGNDHHLIQQKFLKLRAWAASRKVCRRKEYQKGLQPLLKTSEKPSNLNITIRLGANGLAVAVEGKYVPLNVI